MCSIAEEKAGRGRKSAVIPRAAVPPCPRSAGEGIDLVDDGGGFAVIFAGGHDAHGAVTGLEDDDGDHEGGGEAEGEGVSLIEGHVRSEEHTSELQSLMRISYAVFCLKKKNEQQITVMLTKHK